MCVDQGLRYKSDIVVNKEILLEDGDSENAGWMSWRAIFVKGGKKGDKRTDCVYSSEFFHDIQITQWRVEWNEIDVEHLIDCCCCRCSHFFSTQIQTHASEEAGEKLHNER